MIKIKKHCTFEDKKTTMEKETLNIQHLLSQVTAINKKYEQIAEITGENFNVFKILGLTTNEVRTHSAFIAELLDPKGSHGCKDTFLKLFVEKMQNLIKEQTEGSNENDNQILERIKKFICSDKCKTYVEYHISETNEDKTIGGRIDILLRDSNKQEIIIENKIYAGEQTNQLIRYYNFNLEAPILYLTLNGDSPSSIKDENHILIEYENYLCISYEKDIIEWLGLCRKESVDKPILRETITQYINLIKHLTNQTINNKMKDEIINLATSSKQNLESTLSLFKLNSKIKSRIQELFWSELEAEITKQYKNQLIISSNYKEKLSGYYAERGKYDYMFGGIQVDLFSISDNEKIQFFIEVGNNVYYGYKVVDNYLKSINNNIPNYNTYKERIENFIRSMPRFPECHYDGNQWLMWSFTSFGTQLNFRDFNSDLIYEIADSKRRNEIISQIKEESEILINSFIKNIVHQSKTI